MPMFSRPKSKKQKRGFTTNVYFFINVVVRLGSKVRLGLGEGGKGLEWPGWWGDLSNSMPMKYPIWSPSSNQTPSSLLERCERRVSGALKPDSFGLVGLIGHLWHPTKTAKSTGLSMSESLLLIVFPRHADELWYRAKQSNLLSVGSGKSSNVFSNRVNVKCKLKV